MRRVLAAAVLVAFMPTANAQDKGKADFSTNAEFRARWLWFQNPSFDEKAPDDGSMAESRFKIGAGYKANEKVSAHATLIHNANFGLDNTTDNVQPATTAGNNNQHPITDGAEDMLIVNEVYATWMSSDDLNFKIGRQNFHVADGVLVSTNDWEKVPYSFEGVLGSWEQEWGKLQLALFKVRNLNGAGTSSSSDPEHNMYGINFDLKTKPEWLKAFNAHIFKDNSDAVAGGTGTTVMKTTNGLDTMRYGIMAGFGFADFDAKLNWEKQGGKIKNISAAPAYTKTDMDYSGDMMQLEVGYTLASFMGSRWFALYHKDSGDDNAGDNELGTYDPYYTDTHAGAGYMDIIGWGNLTDTAIGWTMKPQDKTDVGLTYHMFKRTESCATCPTPNMDKYGGFVAQTNANDKADLGSEIDIWATHHYDGGLSTTAFIGYFTPGDYFSDDTNAVPPGAGNPKQDAKALYVLIEGKATF